MVCFAAMLSAIDRSVQVESVILVRSFVGRVCHGYYSVIMIARVPMLSSASLQFCTEICYIVRLCVLVCVFL